MRGIGTLVFLLCSVHALAQVDTIAVRRLSTAWISQDAEGRARQIVDAKNVSVGGFYLAEAELREGLLRICGAEFDLWVEGRLFHHEGSRCKHFTSTEIFAEQSADTVYCAIVSNSLDQVTVDLQMIRPSVERIYELPGARARDVSADAWWLLLITVLILIAVLRAADDQTYKAMVRLSFLQRRVGYEEDALLSVSNLLMMLLLGLLLGFHIVIFQGDNGSLRQLLSALGAATLMFYAYLVLKMLILQVTGSLFKYRRVKTLHFRSYLLFMTIFMLLLYMLQLTGYWFQVEGEWYWQLIRYAGPAISAVFVIWIYFQLSSEVAKRKLHIISYLCTTEILPTFILANWLLN